MEFDLIQLLSDFGLPATVTIIIVIFYKQQNDKQYSAFLKMIGESKEKDKKIEEVSTDLKSLAIEIERLVKSINDLKSSLFDLFKKDK